MVDFLGNLFAESEASSGTTSAYNKSSSSGYGGDYLTRPPSKRKLNHLAGIVNQGATCYLNTLIQTLYFTREFRESIFSVTADELGLLPSTSGQVKVRVILIELQRLFGNLMLLDQDACSTNRLTDSFGWTNNEEMQQHDVQELNRILFAAIEKSLINTRNAKFIHELYRGTYVNKIRCLSCQNVFEREEEFFDIPITVQGSDGLKTSLVNSFQMREGLNGNNQYRCEKCDNQYRDAEKYCQLKTLPPILTLSLLRFTYDLRTFQRIKETSRFEFPLEIDLNEFMEDSYKLQVEPEYSQYELYSVIIHSGNAYGGHYHTYIRDFDHLGKWTREARSDDKHSRTKIGPQNNPALFADLAVENQDQREIQLICLEESDPDFDEQSQLVNLDYRSYSSPLELLKAHVYNKHKFEYAELARTHAELKQAVHGELTFDHLFVAPSYERLLDASFELSPDRNTFRLRECDRINIVSKKNLNEASSLLSQAVAADDDPPSYFDIVQESQRPRDDLLSSVETPEPNPWFDFDDSRVSSITSQEIVNQFEGRESAYMLFYRRRNTNPLPDNANAEQDQSHLHVHHAKVPAWIRHEIEAENSSLAQKRDAYEDQVNKFTIDCHLDADFYLDEDVLNMHPQCEGRPFALAVDKRTTTIGQLRERLVSSCTELLARKSNTPGELVERREELFLNTLLDQEVELHWLLCCRVENPGDDGVPGYFVKCLLDNHEGENVHLAITSNAHKNSKSLLMVAKDKTKWPVGENYLPIRLVVRYFNNEIQLRESSFTFTRATLLSKLKETVSEFILSENRKLFGDQGTIIDGQQLSAVDMRFSYVQRAYLVQQDKVLLTEVFMDKTIDEVWLRNGDYIIVETFMDLDESLVLKNAINTTKPTTTSVLKTYQVKMVGCLASPFRCEVESFDSSTLVSTVKNLAALRFIDFATHDNTQYHLRFVNSETLSENKWLLDVVSPPDAASDDSERLKGDLTLATTSIGVTVHDDITLGHVLETLSASSSVGTYPARNRTELAEASVDSLVLLFCHGKAPLSYLQEVVLRCSLETTDCALDLTNSQIMTEVIVDLDNVTIEDLTRQVVSKMRLEPLEPSSPQQYILKTTNWLGDSENVLNSVSLSCREAKLKHNQLLLIGKGKLIPPNHVKIRLWQQKQQAPLEATVASMTLSEEVKVKVEDDLVVLNTFIEDRYRQFGMLEELVVKYDTKLDDLKETVLAIVNKHRQDGPVENIRLRALRKVFATTSTDQLSSSAGGPRFITKKALIDWHKSLRQLHLLPETDLCVQVIAEDEESQVNQGTVIVCCVQISLKSRKVHRNTFKEIFWNVNNGATLSTLKDSILKAYPDSLRSSDLFEMHVAKRQVEKFQWILLKEQAASASSDTAAASSKIKRQKSQNQPAKINLRHAPYAMDDGDLVAFTLEKPQDGQKMDAQLFMSEEDLSFYSKKEMSSAELARVRRDKKKNSPEPGAASQPLHRSVRPEIGIKIEIDDY